MTTPGTRQYAHTLPEQVDALHDEAHILRAKLLEVTRERDHLLHFTDDGQLALKLRHAEAILRQCPHCCDEYYDRGGSPDAE